MMTHPNPPPNPAESWRERKRGQTRQRIAEAGLQLFLREGYEATTLDAIAEAAGIARRTFFHYFDSKEALLSAYEDDAEQSFSAALACTPDTMPPFEAMRSAIMAMVSSFGTDDAKAIDRLMRSTAALCARKQADYERLERFVGAALAEKWPDPDHHLRLRMIAMVGIGTLRIAADRWSADQSTRCIQDYLNDGFVSFLSDLSSQITAFQKS
jgi:AcrR family transcriptional regulator